MPPMFNRSKPIALVVAFATVALAAVFASSASAGFGADPRIDDVQLGKKHGIAYVKDTETVVDSGSTLASTGCPGKGDSWRVAGGGFSAGRPFNLINMSRPLDYTDADHAADDYWEVESNAAGVGTKVTGYAICMKERKLRYASAIAPDSSDGNRTLSIDCPGGTKPIGGGGSISHSDSFLSSLYPSGNSWNVDAYDSLGGTGNLTADAVCLKSKHVETVKRRFRVAADSNRNVKVLAEAPAMPMGNVYQTQRCSIVIPAPGIPCQPVFSSHPFDGRDKDKLPDDGWEIGASNPSSKSLRVTAYLSSFKP